MIITCAKSASPRFGPNPLITIPAAASGNAAENRPERSTQSITRTNGQKTLASRAATTEVIMLVDRDVVIDSGATLLPLGVDVGLHRQRLQGGLVQPLEQLLAIGAEVARDLVVEPVQKWANGSVHIPEAEELTVAQPRARSGIIRSPVPITSDQ